MRNGEHLWRATALLAALACGVAVADDGVLRIDFGTESSPVRTGWRRVTHKTKWATDAAVGWVDPNGLWSKDWPLSREWTYSESRGRKYPPPVYMTDLRRDHVGGRGGGALRLRAEDGDYGVWLLLGTAGGRREAVWHTAVIGEHPSVERHDGFRRFAQATVAGPYEPRVLKVGARAAGGVLEVRFASGSQWNVSALVAARLDTWDRLARDEIAGIHREVFHLPGDVRSEWREGRASDGGPRPQPTEREKARGFLLYHRHALSPIWPDTTPRRDECDPTLRVFCSLGEYEPLTFTILPVEKLAYLSVDVGELKNAAGQVLSESSWTVRQVRYMHVRPNYSTHGTHYRAPDLLMPLDGPLRELDAKENVRIWLTVRAGASTPPGLYRGEATISTMLHRMRDVKPLPLPEVQTKLPIELRVLPIKLQQDRSLVYGTYYRHPYDRARRAPDAFSRRWWERKAEYEFADMAAHGLNAYVDGISGKMDEAGRWTMDFDALGAKIDLARRHGFDKPVICHIPTSVVWRKHMTGQMGSHLRLVKELPPKGFFEDMTRMVAAIEAGRKRRQWPELLYYPIDEPGRGEAHVRFMVEVLKAIRRVPGVRTYVTADPAHEAFAPMKPHVDVWCCQPFSVPREQVLADAAKGVEYWCYPNHIAGENDHTPAAGARMTYGFGFWRSGFKALTPWIYQSVVGDPWNYLDGAYMDFFNRTDDEGRPIPCVLWECYREGIDDVRYVTTLRRWIARAREAGRTKKADAAEKELKFVWDSIDVQEKYKYDGLWDPETFDVYRWLIAKQILDLQEALGTR